jgi:hypothetical protein
MDNIMITTDDFVDYVDDDMFGIMNNDVEKKIYIESKLFLSLVLAMVKNDDLIRYMAAFSTIYTVKTIQTYYINVQDDKASILCDSETEHNAQPILFDYFLPSKIVEIRVWQVNPTVLKIELTKKSAWRGLSTLRKKYQTN